MFLEPQHGSQKQRDLFSFVLQSWRVPKKGALFGSGSDSQPAQYHATASVREHRGSSSCLILSRTSFNLMIPSQTK